MLSCARVDRRFVRDARGRVWTRSEDDLLNNPVAREGFEIEARRAERERSDRDVVRSGGAAVREAMAMTRVKRII